jgi:aryl-alcohol dehydrogenase-like predicted oxidoreductase
MGWPGAAVEAGATGRRGPALVTSNDTDKERRMLMRKLGRTGLRVAALCLGGNTFGWTTDQRASEDVLDAYVEAGGNFIDTADVYSRWAPGNSGGESETALGKWLTARGHRHGVLIATKVMGPMGPGPNDTGLSRQHIMQGVEASLRRLETDYIDLYQSHWDDRETPLEETLRAFDDLVSQGKVRYLGCSNHQAWRLTRALWESDRRGYARYESLQPKYNLVFRDEYERELEPLCLEQGVGVIPYSSLASGFLSGKYRPGKDLPATARAAGVQKTYMNDRGFAVLEAVEKVAARAGATPAQVALSWLAHRPGITAPIASATSVAQLRELIGGIDLRLDEEATATLDRASAWRDS